MDELEKRTKQNFSHSLPSCGPSRYYTKLGFILSIAIKNKSCKLTFYEFTACFASLASSIYEDRNIRYTLRPMSKIVFNILALICLCLCTGPFWVEDPVLSQIDIPSNISVHHYCENICNKTEISHPWISLCRTFSQPPEAYHGILISLWILLALSTLEGILERFFKFMPHWQFLEPCAKLVKMNEVLLEPMICSNPPRGRLITM